MIGNHVIKVQSKAASLSGSSRKTVRSVFNIGAPLQIQSLLNRFIKEKSLPRKVYLPARGPRETGSS